MKRLQVVILLVVPALAALAQAGTFTTLYNFTGGTDGGRPNAAVIQDEFGNLYGTTIWGGDLSCGSYNSGCGVVYKLDTAGNETALHNFSKIDGQNPFTPVVRDSDGSLYGTTEVGGSNSYGVVFKIDTAGNETVLYSFAGGTSDGCYPTQGVIIDEAGSLYGTTSECGTSNDGTVFKVDSSGNETILHNFAGTDGRGPFGGHLILDNVGSLYGVACCGSSGYGMVFKLNKKGTLTVLYSFAGPTDDGCYPYGTPAMDKSRNYGGGTVWKYEP